MVNDVSRAYFYADATEPTYVKLCEEDMGEGEQGMCGRLNKAMYGTRTAAREWQKEFTKVLRELNVTSGKASPCIFYNAKKLLKTYVHGDDFVTTGPVTELQWLEKELKKRYNISTLVA